MTCWLPCPPLYPPECCFTLASWDRASTVLHFLICFCTPTQSLLLREDLSMRLLVLRFLCISWVVLLLPAAVPQWPGCRDLEWCGVTSLRHWSGEYYVLYLDELGFGLIRFFRLDMLISW